ncbi:hypothetical protein [Burkholderia gladioli]|uniref:hypothetical protein n=1 Tax=Burkholderia gladioli TaxID=28095 RepID=UPI0016415CB3|nr:hypothetical protein [Burkholderia gladioli]
MKNQQKPFSSNRAALADAVSRFHLADRRLKFHRKMWSARSTGLVAVIDRFWAAERAAPHPDFVPVDLRREGEAAIQLSVNAADRRDRLMHERHDRLVEALSAMGAYFGAMMARDARGSLLHRLQRHMKCALDFRQRNIDGVRPTLPDVFYASEFESMVTWARAIGYRSANALFDDLLLESDMRSGRRALSLDDAERLGMDRH